MCVDGSEGQSEVTPLAQERNGLTRGAEIKVPVVLGELIPSAQEHCFAFLMQDAEVHGSGV